MSAPRTHWWPRSATGRRVVTAFLATFALAQPPVVLLANRIEPTPFGVGFLYAYLTGVYVVLMAILLWAHRRDL